MKEYDVVDLYANKNKTIKEISNITSFSRGKIYYILAKHNIPLRQHVSEQQTIIKQNKNEIIGLYKAGKKIADISRLYNVSDQAIYVALNTWNIRKIHNKKRDKALTSCIIEMYRTGFSVPKISERLELSEAVLYAILKAEHIQVRDAHLRNRNCVNDTYFYNVDTEEKAYWLGFLMADGYITKNGVGLAIAKKDKHHLEKFKVAIASSGKIHAYTSSGYSTTQYCRLTVTSAMMKQDLINHGCIRHKSLVLKYPLCFSQSLDRHFIRGYFDGDGSLILSRNQNYGFKLCGTKEFLQVVIDRLNMNIPSYTFKSTFYQSPRMYGKNNYYISFGGKNKVYAIMNWLYEDTTISLDRKFEKYATLKNIVESTRKSGC